MEGQKATKKITLKTAQGIMQWFTKDNYLSHCFMQRYLSLGLHVGRQCVLTQPLWVSVLAVNTQHTQTGGLQMGDGQLNLHLFHFISHHFQHLRQCLRGCWLALAVQLEMGQRREILFFSLLMKFSKAFICIKLPFHWWIKREDLKNPAQTAYSRNGKWQHMHTYNHMGNNNSTSQCTA